MINRLFLCFSYFRTDFSTDSCRSDAKSRLSSSNTPIITLQSKSHPSPSDHQAACRYDLILDFRASSFKRFSQLLVSAPQAAYKPSIRAFLMMGESFFLANLYLAAAVRLLVLLPIASLNSFIASSDLLVAVRNKVPNTGISNSSKYLF